MINVTFAHHLALKSLPAAERSFLPMSVSRNAHIWLYAHIWTLFISLQLILFFRYCTDKITNEPLVKKNSSTYALFISSPILRCCCFFIGFLWRLSCWMQYQASFQWRESNFWTEILCVWVRVCTCCFRINRSVLWAEVIIDVYPWILQASTKKRFLLKYCLVESRGNDCIVSVLKRGKFYHNSCKSVYYIFNFLTSRVLLSW